MIQPSTPGLDRLGKIYSAGQIRSIIQNAQGEPVSYEDLRDWVLEHGGQIHPVEGIRVLPGNYGGHGYLVHLSSAGHLLFKLAWYNG